MVIETDVVQQVAEMQCQECGGYKLTGEEHQDPSLCTIGLCGSCEGTGLLWTSLSWECRSYLGVIDYSDEETAWPKTHKGCQNCNGSGRISDVTLDKVLDASGARWTEIYKHEDGGFDVHLFAENSGMIGSGFGETRELASCAALLDTVVKSS